MRDTKRNKNREKKNCKEWITRTIEKRASTKYKQARERRKKNQMPSLWKQLFPRSSLFAFLFFFPRKGKMCEASDMKGNWKGVEGGKERSIISSNSNSNEMHSFECFQLHVPLFLPQTFNGQNCTLRNVKSNKLLWRRRRLSLKQILLFARLPLHSSPMQSFNIKRNFQAQ